MHVSVNTKDSYKFHYPGIQLRYHMNIFCNSWCVKACTFKILTTVYKIFHSENRSYLIMCNKSSTLHCLGYPQLRYEITRPSLHLNTTLYL